MNHSAALIVVNSSALRHRPSAWLSNSRMKTVEEVRRARLAMLVKEFKSYAELNEKLGRPRRDATLTQYANQSVGSKTAKRKGMGSATARLLESACKKEPGWMDTDPELWPFLDIDHQKVTKLLGRHRNQLEGALLMTAAELGIDIKKAVGA